MSSWKKMKKGGDFESVVNAVSSMAVLDAFRVEGPLELRVGGDDELSLLLPVCLNLDFWLWILESIITLLHIASFGGKKLVL